MRGREHTGRGGGRGKADCGGRGGRGRGRGGRGGRGKGGGRDRNPRSERNVSPCLTPSLAPWLSCEAKG